MFFHYLYPTAMKYVDSGCGKIPLITLIGILSISLTVNLPGLAISPLLDKLDSVFPHVTELETQLLVTLPNLVIIPFILWSGKLCNMKDQITVLVIGLVIYTVSGLLFLFANSMIELIILSCCLGVGCGLVIPLAASLIAQNFDGKSRTKQLGWKSGTSNFMVIVATLFVGWIAKAGWHLAFLVYLVPLIPLCLVPFMTRKFIDKYRIPEIITERVVTQEVTDTNMVAAKVASKEQAKEDAKPSPVPIPEPPHFSFTKKHGLILLLGLIGVYISMTYGAMAIGDYLSYTMDHYHLGTAQAGIATALFYFGATMAGFALTPVIKYLQRLTPYVAIMVCIIGLFGMGCIHHYWMYIIGCLIIGLGYGIIQPIVYDKTSQIAPDSQKSTEYFGYTLTGNYIAIALVPFVVGGCADIFHCSTINFPYILNGFILLGVLVWGFVKCRSFIFYVTSNEAKVTPLNDDGTPVITDTTSNNQK